MICPRCGAPTTPADKFCAICASPIGPPAPPGYGAPPPGFGPPPPPPGFGPPPDQGGFGPPPPAPPGFDQGGFGPPPNYGQQQNFGPPQYGNPPGPAPGFGPPPDYGSPNQGFGQPPPPPNYGPPPDYGPPPEPPGFGPPPGYGPPPGFGGGFGQPEQNYAPQGFGQQQQQQGARCVQGHAIPQGGSFCMEGGHPIALEGMHIGGEAFGATAFAPGVPMPPTGAMSGYGSEPQQQQQQRAATQLPGQPVHPAQPAAQEGRRTLAGFLVSYQDDALGKFWPLWNGRNVVGRAETGQDVDIAIGHGTTSTTHAAIECDGGRFTLSDLGSTNGTFHNEEAIGFQGRRDLRDGDKIRFGGYTVVVLNAAARV